MNTSPTDKWTLVHIAFGAAAGALGVSPVVALGGAVAYEFVEQAVEKTPEGQKLFGSNGPESMTNAVVDVLVFGAAYYLTRRL